MLSVIPLTASMMFISSALPIILSILSTSPQLLQGYMKDSRAPTCMSTDSIVMIVQL